MLSVSFSFRPGWTDSSLRSPSLLHFSASKLLVPALGGCWSVCSLCVYTEAPPPPSAQSSPWGLQLLLYFTGVGGLWGPHGGGDPCYSGQRKERGGPGAERGSAWFSGCPDREQRDPVYLKEKVTQRHCKEQFETAQKIEQEYSRYFTGACAS